MRSSLLQALIALLLPLAQAASPVVQSDAGTFRGRYIPEFDQDVFLGIKYATKPVRFAPSSLVKGQPERHFNVTTYGTDCTGYGSDTDLLVKQGWTTLGEDCLHLNIIKPNRSETDLPILLWIYGGGWQQGATSDPRYRYAHCMHIVSAPNHGIATTCPTSSNNPC